MKKTLMMLIALVMLPLSVNAAQFKEGVNYEVIKQTATAKPEVLEFFSYYCPHCNTFEPLIAELKANLDKNVTLKKNHVDFLGGGMGPQLTRALAAAEMLEVEDKFSSIVFDKIHTKRQQINGEKGILEIFAQVGVSESEAKGAMASFPAVGLASQMKRNTETFKIRGVPAIIVNGKYQVTTGSVRNTKEFIELVNYLTKKTD